MTITCRHITQVKYIVFEENLLSLFTKCFSCGSHSINNKKFVNGTFLHIKQTCNVCEAVNNWDSQPHIKNFPAGNILLSASILYTGSLPEKAIQLLNSFSCATISTRTFYDHQKQFLVPTVLYAWDIFQQAVFA
jgi:solute carrier family 8 (sodium/calcium exchanger)